MLNKIFNRSLRGDIEGGSLFVVAILLGIVGFATVLTRGVVPPTASPSGDAVTIVPPAPDTEKKNLQLYTFGYTTPAPTVPPAPTIPPIVSTPRPTTPPTSACPFDGAKTPGCGACIDFESAACDENPCILPGSQGYLLMDGFPPPQKCLYQDPFDKKPANSPIRSDPAAIKNHDIFVKKLTEPQCVAACIYKPVIYLYPTSPTLVDVAVTVPGKIVVSDPLYPENGWKNVLAQPNGQLTYKNKTYNELFFESDVDKVNAPDNGIIIAKKDLKEKLTDATTKLGLNKSEQKEFLDFWIPKLNKLNSPFILFSLIDPTEKERIDHVEIVPEPDTLIAFIAYFKPLKNRNTNLKPLTLPLKPPERIGFTAVEWGGTIDKH